MWPELAPTWTSRPRRCREVGVEASSRISRYRQMAYGIWRFCAPRHPCQYRLSLMFRPGFCYIEIFNPDIFEIRTRHGAQDTSGCSMSACRHASAVFARGAHTARRNENDEASLDVYGGIVLPSGKHKSEPIKPSCFRLGFGPPSRDDQAKSKLPMWSWRGRRSTPGSGQNLELRVARASLNARATNQRGFGPGIARTHVEATSRCRLRFGAGVVRRTPTQCRNVTWVRRRRQTAARATSNS